MVLHQLVGDVQSYSGPDLERPGLNHALELLGAGEATCLSSPASIASAARPPTWAR